MCPCMASDVCSGLQLSCCCSGLLHVVIFLPLHHALEGFLLDRNLDPSLHPTPCLSLPLLSVLVFSLPFLLFHLLSFRAVSTVGALLSSLPQFEVCASLIQTVFPLYNLFLQTLSNHAEVGRTDSQEPSLLSTTVLPRGKRHSFISQGELVSQGFTSGWAECGCCYNDLGRSSRGVRVD